MKYQLYALHGMFGLPSDWDFLEEPVCKISLLDAPPKKFWRWAKTFNTAVMEERKTPRILIGYSMGARLALHALLQNPSLWSGAVLISGNTGLHTAHERLKQMETDLAWALRIQNMPWETLLQKWNARPPLCYSPPVDRAESHFSRTFLSQALLQWSLALQENLQKPLAELSLPLLFVTGAKDQKYTELAEQLHLRSPLSRHWICPEAGHRVPWEYPHLFNRVLNTFCEDLHEANDHTLARH